MKSSAHFPSPAENFLSHSLIDSRRCSLWRSSTCELHKSRISFPGGLVGLEEEKKNPHSALCSRESGLAAETNWRHAEGLPAEHHCWVVHQLEKFKRRVGMPNATVIPLRKLEPGRPSLLPRNLRGCLCGLLYARGVDKSVTERNRRKECVLCRIEFCYRCWRGREEGLPWGLAWLGKLDGETLEPWRRPGSGNWEEK